MSANVPLHHAHNPDMMDTWKISNKEIHFLNSEVVAEVEEVLIGDAITTTVSFIRICHRISLISLEA